MICCFKNEKNLVHFDPSTQKFPLKNQHFNWSSLIIFDVNKTKELSFMALEIDAKFEEHLTSDMENNMSNLTNFHQSN